MRFDNMSNLKIKKKDFKIGFLKYGRVVDTRPPYSIFIYIYIYKRKERRKHPLHPRGITIHTRFLSLFFI